MDQSPTSWGELAPILERFLARLDALEKRNGTPSTEVEEVVVLPGRAKARRR